jgi:membrane protein implicated in regulation of membrane protease activity
MTLETFYLVCFVVGFAFTAISFLGGSLHFHFPGHGHVHLGGHGAHHGGGHFPFFSPMSIAVFLAWFGGTGYLLTHLHILAFAGLALASLAGLVGAAIVFFFVAKFLMARDFTLNPEDFDMIGMLGTVSSSIRKEGTGEMIFEQQGTRRACPARSEEGSEIKRGEEVVVTRYDQGVAYVRRWDDLAAGAGILPEERKEPQ